MMQRYPGRVYSKPEFVALPPFLFSGAEFALIPSRDEPFGLVAVEFGRKGALGVGSRVGGLGQMPGWWYPIEVNILHSCPRSKPWKLSHGLLVPTYQGIGDDILEYRLILSLVHGTETSGSPIQVCHSIGFGFLSGD